MKIHLTVGPPGQEQIAKNWVLDHVPREGELVNYHNTTGVVIEVLHDYDAKTIYIRAW